MFKTIKEKKENNKLVGYTVVFKDDKESFIPLAQNCYTKDIEHWVENGGVIEPFETEGEKVERELKEKVSQIEQHIYSFYSEKKQSQDRGYQAYSQTVIVGQTSQTDTPVTLDALTIEVMDAVLQVWSKTITLKDFINTKPIALQEHYAKLVKIGSLLKWTKMCIDEGKLAMVESREPSYPPYPNFGGA